MKGVIFNAVEEIVRAEHGEDVWDDLLESAGLSGAYTSLGTYPDEQMTALVDAASASLGVSHEDLLRHLGRRVFSYLAARNPELMTAFSDSRSLLRGLNSVIHPEVRKIYVGRRTSPDFQIDLRWGRLPDACRTGRSAGCATSPRASASGRATTSGRP